MIKTEAEKIITETFQKEYDDVRFLKFINEILNGESLKYGSADYVPLGVKSTYRGFIEKYRLFGLYEDPNKNELYF